MPQTETQNSPAAMTAYQSFIHMTRYSRWLPEAKRRETWTETVQRYVNFFTEERGADPRAAAVLKDEIFPAIHNMKVMPSMRALMTAGEALRRENIAGFNCSYIAVNNKRSFSEALYILMCFHPDTLVVTKRGNVAIKSIVPGDLVQSFNQQTKEFYWCRVLNQVKTPSSHKPKVAVKLDNGTVVRCTADHQWLTTNRGWVEAQDLTQKDDLVAPTHQVYKLTNKTTGKAYVGMTGKRIEQRFAEHCQQAAILDHHLARAISKYGVADFVIEQIDTAYSEAEAFAKEIQWIETLGTYGAGGYNSTCGGEGSTGYKWTAEQRQQASENAYERTDAHRDAQRQVLAKAQEKIVQTRQTQTYRDSQRERNLGMQNPMHGKKHSDERKAQISAHNTGTANPFFGRKHTEETKEKIRATKANNKLQGAAV